MLGSYSNIIYCLRCCKRFFKSILKLKIDSRKLLLQFIDMLLRIPCLIFIYISDKRNLTCFLIGFKITVFLL